MKPGPIRPVYNAGAAGGVWYKNTLMKIGYGFLLLVLFGCRDEVPARWQTLDCQTFTVQAPPRWRHVARVGYDSRVGELTNGKVTLRYDYGRYSYPFGRETATTHRRTNLTLDGRPAFIVEPKQRGKGVIGLYVTVDAGLRLSIYGTNIPDHQLIRQLFSSVRFS